MALAHQFSYMRPGSLPEALDLLAATPEAAVLAGGTDLVPNMREGIQAPSTVIDIKAIEGLDKITFDGKTLDIGALVTFADLIDSEIIINHFPVMCETAKTVASTAIRNRATLAGNICSAVPCMDSGPLLLAYDAKINVTSPGGKRSVPAAHWFKGNRKSDLKKGEILTSISIPLPAENHAGCYIKLGRYHGEDLAQASVLVLCLPGNRYRVAFGSVAPVPVHARRIEALLKGKPLSDDLLESAKALVPEEISPITDIRASKEYRMHMSQVMLVRALNAAAERLAGSGPAYGTLLV
jgi:CO/xanthine dehydrogenase FAD-binding subunit